VTVLPFRPRRPTRLSIVVKPRLEPCACCLGRPGDIQIRDRAFCISCDQYIRTGEIAPVVESDGVVMYEAVTPGSATWQEGGFEMFDRAHQA